MKLIKLVFIFLSISGWAKATEIMFSSLRPFERTSINEIERQEKILSVNGEGSTFIIKMKSSTLEVPLINEQEVSRAIDDFKFSGKNIFCTMTQDAKNCEGLRIKYDYKIERTKLFPNYYKNIEVHCKTLAGDMLYGTLGYSGGYNMNSLLALATGESPSFKGYLSLPIFERGTLKKTLFIQNEKEIVYLNNTNPLHLNVWVYMDDLRKKAVLLEGSSCKSVGEISYK